ncbi:inactive TPR repeat-containing thioredoxin TTL3-like [Bidens hawaiensis]|uniref:inactive TPR repeat-containing thioredoxin TTL3-like n=1 Tax=Bidens hawaiensis TaxID=980011 RepID=UPI004049B84C
MTDLTKYGCGILNVVFGRRLRRSASSTGTLSTADVPSFVITTNNKSGSSRQNGVHNERFDCSSSAEQPQKKTERIIGRPSQSHKTTKATPPMYKALKVSNSISGELEAMIDENERLNYAGNMKVYGNLGNIHPKRNQEVLPNGMGNISRKTSKEIKKPANTTSYCRALSTRMDPEQLKIMGNEDYKNGRFAEALSLYDAAISIDPEKASYRSNKSAALTCLGRLLEAVFEAREAIRIEPFYQRAHSRLATLYLRLGDADKTARHYKQAGSECEANLIIKAQALQLHLNRCNEAKKRRDWSTLLKETSLAISAGADSALQIHTLKAEGLLKLHRHYEADQVLSKAPKFDIDDCTKFYGSIIHAYLLLIRAQVDLAAGRLDDAMEAAQMAVKMDPNNKDVNMMVHKTKAVMGARSKGNGLFKAAEYSEACIVYGEGLDHEPFNSLLLCNRAACRSKLGQFEKAIEDCTMALNIRPSYSKARLRRADCNSKLGKWQASIDDYEILRTEAPEDEQVCIAFRQAKEELQMEAIR